MIDATIGGCVGSKIIWDRRWACTRTIRRDCIVSARIGNANCLIDLVVNVVAKSIDVRIPGPQLGFVHVRRREDGAAGITVFDNVYITLMPDTECSRTGKVLEGVVEAI